MKRLSSCLLLALAYVAFGKIGLSLALVNPSATAVWPPAGIVLTVFLLAGIELWPGAFIGAFLVNLATAGTIYTSLAIAAGNTLEGVLAATLVLRFARGRQAFDHPYTLFKFTVLAGILSPAVAATFGVTALRIAGFISAGHAGPVWLTWWLGDAAAILILTPLLVLWRHPSGNPNAPRRWAEAAAVGTLIVLSGLFVFGDNAAAVHHYPLEFLCMPLILWAAFRLDQRATAAAVLLLAVPAIGGTLAAKGPFAVASTNTSLLLLQTFLSVTSMMSLAVAAVVAERRRYHQMLEGRIEERTTSLEQTLRILEDEVEGRERAEWAARVSEDRFRRLLDSNIIGTIVVDAGGRVTEANDAFLSLVGCRREQVTQKALNIIAMTPSGYQTQESWAWEQIRQKGYCPAVEKELIHANGSHVAVLAGGILLDAAPERAIFFVIDATHRRQAMEALRKAYDEMETRIEERTREVSTVNFELAKEVARRRQVEDELRELSLKDPLTGLYNRRGFLALAEQQWLQACRDRREFLVFFADVDGLKSINDNGGHACGDDALRLTADALRRTFRKSDIVARLGGDEFAIVTGEGSEEGPDVYVERLKRQLDEINQENRIPFKLTLSLGVATFDKKETTTLEDLLRYADEDLYAHRNGRNRSTL